MQPGACDFRVRAFEPFLIAYYLHWGKGTNTSARFTRRHNIRGGKTQFFFLHMASGPFCMQVHFRVVSNYRYTPSTIDKLSLVCYVDKCTIFISLKRI